MLDVFSITEITCVFSKNVKMGFTEITCVFSENIDFSKKISSYDFSSDHVVFRPNRV